MPRPLAVITGASSGLGEVYAKKLAPSHDLLLIARRLDRLQALAAHLAADHGCAVSTLAADLTNEHDLALAADRIRASDNLALLINNAGFGKRGVFWDSDLQAEEQMHRLHIMATLRLTHAALARMVPANSGAIINVASVAGFIRRAGAVSYGATKSWINDFSEGIWLELKAANSAVKIQSLCPGFTYTEFHEVAKVDRAAMASKSFWMTADFVVSESLKALPSGKLYVVPGWRYKVIVAVLSVMPNWLRLAVEASMGNRTPKPRES